MNRSMDPNPDFPSRRVMTLALWHPPMVAEFDEAIPAEPPAGFHNAVWRDERGRIVLGLRKNADTVEAAPATAPKADGLESRSLEELQTLAGRKGIAYKKATPREDLIANIRAKGAA